MTIKHSTDPDLLAFIGHDSTPGVGWFCTVERDGEATFEYDGMATGQTSTLRGVLDTLVRFEFFSRDSLEEALDELPHQMTAEIADPLVRRVAEVVEGLRSSAAEG